MATRVYLPSTGTPGISPAFGSDWQHTSNADRISGVTTRINSGMTGKAGLATVDLNDQLGRQYLVGPLAAQTIAGTISGVCRASSTNLGIGEQALSLSKCAIDGSGVTLIVAVNATTADDGYPGATATARQFWVDGSITDTTIDIPSTDLDAGDYLLVEIGWRKSTANLGRFPTWIFGDDSGTDLGANETDTAANNPWVEFSADLSFLGAAIDAELTATLGNMTLSADARVHASIEQEKFRFGLDDGSESTHTFADAEDANISVAADTTRLLRITVDTNAIDAPDQAYKLQYRQVGNLTWRDVQ